MKGDGSVNLMQKSTYGTLFLDAGHENAFAEHMLINELV